MRRCGGALALVIGSVLAGCTAPGGQGRLERLYLDLSDAARGDELLDPLYDVLSPASKERLDWPDLMFLLATPSKFRDFPDVGGLFACGRFVQAARGPRPSEWFVVIRRPDADYRLLFILDAAGDLRMGLVEQMLLIASNRSEYSWIVDDSQAE